MHRVSRMTCLSFKTLRLNRHVKSLVELSESITHILPQNEIPIRWSIVAVEAHQWVIEVGIRASDGRFFMLVRSNAVRTPAFGFSSVLDEEWLCPDELYWKLLGMAGDWDKTKSSLNLKEIWEKHLRQALSSESARVL